MTIAPNPDPEPNPLVPSHLHSATRPARALIGWMPPDEAQLTLNGRVMGRPASLDHARRAQEACEQVGRRPIHEPSDAVITPLPASLAGHAAAVGQTPVGAGLFGEGWSLALVDLTRVCAIQSVVHTDHASDRIASVDADDLNSIAAVTLPTAMDAELPAQFDEHQRSWIITSPNPNLRIVGHTGGPVQPGMFSFGFVVAVQTSFVQVALFRGRYVLRDGYHRSVALLRAGIETVPVMYREFPAFEDLGMPPGLLAPSAYLGERPPLLPDFLDDAVSADVQMPATQRLIVVHGLALNSAA